MAGPGKPSQKDNAAGKTVEQRQQEILDSAFLSIAALGGSFVAPVLDNGVDTDAFQKKQTDEYYKEKNYGQRITKAANERVLIVAELNERIQQDPDGCGNRIVLGYIDEQENRKILRDALEDINKDRLPHSKHTQPPWKMSKKEIDKTIDDIIKAGEKDGPVEYPLPGGGAIAYLPINENSDFMVNAFLERGKSGFLKSGRDAEGGTFTPLHECGHLLGLKEVGADAFAMLYKITKNEKHMPQKLEAIAACRDLDMEPGHGPGADALLRLKHDIEGDDGAFRATIASMGISELAHLATLYQTTSPSPDDPHIKKAMAFAREILHTDEPAAALPAGKSAHKVPHHLNCDAAVSLLRLERSFSKNMEGGEHNALTEAMPALWKANPKAFAEAQEYMHDNYGMDVRPPVAVLAPARPAVRLSAPPGM